MLMFIPIRFYLQIWAVFCLLVLVAGAKGADEERRAPDSPALDSMGEQIVYVDQVTPPGQVLPTTSEIWIMFADGMGKMRLTSGHKDQNPRFSPDGKQIIFERDFDGEIWVVPSAGGDVRNLTSTPEVYEKEAHFSNDGESLFLLAPAKSLLTEADIAAEPLLALGVGNVLVQLNPKDGTRRELLGESYRIKAVCPDPDDSNQVLALCNELDAQGKPIPFSDPCVVAVPLDGRVPKMVFAAPKGFQIDLARMGGEYLALKASAPDQASPGVFLLKKTGAGTATAADLKKLEKDVLLSDLSCEGKLLVGTAVGSDVGRWAIVIYDIEAGRWKTVIEE